MARFFCLNFFKMKLYHRKRNNLIGGSVRKNMVVALGRSSIVTFASLPMGS